MGVFLRLLMPAGGASSSQLAEQATYKRRQATANLQQRSRSECTPRQHQQYQWTTQKTVHIISS